MHAETREISEVDKTEDWKVDIRENSKLDR